MEIIKQKENWEKAVDLLVADNPAADKKLISLYVNGLKTLGVISQLNESQIYHFLRLCYDLKLDPLKKEIYAVTYKNKEGGNDLTIVISYLEFIKRAEKDPNYQIPNVTTITTDSNGKRIDFNDIYCIFEGKRKNDTNSFRKVFYMREWNKKQGEWNVKPIHMLEKTAMKNGLAWMYPNACTNFITAEETTFTSTGINPEYESVAPVNSSKVEKVVAPKKTTKKEIKNVLENEVVPIPIPKETTPEEEAKALEDLYAPRAKQIIESFVVMGHTEERVKLAIQQVDLGKPKHEVYELVSQILQEMEGRENE